MKTILTLCLSCLFTVAATCQVATPNLLKDVIYYSALSKSDPQTSVFCNTLYADNYRWEVPEDMKECRGKVQFRGAGLQRLFYVAYGDTVWNYPYERHIVTHLFRDTILFPHLRRSYGKYWYKPILAIKDSSVFERIPKSTKNRYDYIFQAPLEKASSKFLQKGMQKDLELYFEYDVAVEHRMMPCWNITVSAKGKQLLQSPAPGAAFQEYEDDLGDLSYQNAEMRDIILLLESGFGHASDLDLVDRPWLQPPFFDATGIKTPIDFRLNGELMSQIFSHHNDLATFNRFVAELEKYGLKLTKGKRMMKVVVIRDRKH